MSAEVGAVQTLLSSIRRHLFISGVIAFILVGGVGVWGGSTQIAGAVVATGTVVVESNTKQVQHQEGGIVKEIRVQNGDLVEAGDLLVLVDDTVVQANQAVLVKQLSELYAQKTRLLAEQAGSEAIDFTKHDLNDKSRPSVRTIEEHQQHLFQARRNSLDGQKAQLREQVLQLRQQIEGLKAQRDARKEEINFVSHELVDLEALFKKKLVSKKRINELKRDKAQLQGSYSGLIAEIAQAQKEISERNIQFLQIEEDARVEILQQLQETRVSIAKLEEQKIAVDDQLKRLDIRAPRSGYVHDVTVHTVGGVIGSGETIMLIVPQKDLLLVEAQIRPVDIDQLSVDQEARIRLPSFDQRTTPELNAKLKTISADLLQDQISGVQYYHARLTIPSFELQKLNGKLLVPGMPVEVFVKTEGRTVLSYLLKPVSDQIAHALRER